MKAWLGVSFALVLAGGFALGLLLRGGARPGPVPSRFGAYRPADRPDAGASGGSGLEMIRKGPLRVETSAPAPATGRQNLTALARRNEPRYERLAREYTRRYPVIREYGRDWASCEDLRRFNVEYLHDRDPIRFALQVAASPNFGALVKKYAARQEMRDFVADAVRATPPELADAASDYLNKDGKAADLVRRLSQALGLPEGMLVPAAATAGPRRP